MGVCPDDTICTQLPILRQQWKVLVFGIIMQYVHGIFSQLAHRMHQPSFEPLHDIGFAVTPELGPDGHWVSEALFATLFLLFVGWTLSPFITHRKKRFYAIVIWTRFLMVLVACQGLRIASFSVTQLPAPSFHCRAGEESSIKNWPEHWTGHLKVDLGRQVTRGCGDLIFSSHMVFTLSGILIYNEYGSSQLMKSLAWMCGVILSILIIASRKHYTVDILIAWYTVPLVFYMLQRRWTKARQMETLTVMGETVEPDLQDGESGNKDVEMRVVGSIGKVLRVGIEPPNHCVSPLSVIKQPLDHGGSVIWGLQAIPVG